MLRFACASCQKPLSAPEEKAGLRVTCPGCKNPVVIPAATPIEQAVTTAPKPKVSRPAPSAAAPPSRTAPTPGADARPSLGTRLLRELGAIAFATFRQTLKPITLVFEIQRRSRLRRRAGDAQFALGQRLYETQQGDKKLRGRIQSLGERIHSIQDVRGDARAQAAERKTLIMKMAEPLLASKSAPDSMEGEHERARAARERLAAQEKALSGAFGGLLPPSGVGWYRVVAGYALVVLCAFGGWQIYGLATSGARLAREREAQELAAAQTNEQKRQEEEATWAKEKNTEQIVEKCGPSVALIRFKIGKQEGGGTGFMIRPGVLATNAHVIDSVMPEELKVYFPSVKDLAKTPLSARVLYFDRKRDLAFLAVDPKVAPLRLAGNFEFKSGKNITIIGCPGVGAMQLENAVTTGVLSTKTEVEKMPFYQLGASVNPGNSGGPVFDNRGQVIGVVTLKASQESIAFCIPWQDLKDRLDGLEKDDPHRIAAAGQAQHSLHVVVDRVYISSMIYTRVMSTYAQAMREAVARGRPAEEGMQKVRPFMNDLLKKAGPFLVDDKHRAIGTKLLTDAHLTEDVRGKFGDLFKTYTDLKQCVDDPPGNATDYANRAQQLETRFKNNIEALVQSLGLEKRDVHEDDDGLEP